MALFRKKRKNIPNTNTFSPEIYRTVPPLGRVHGIKTINLHHPGLNHRQAADQRPKSPADHHRTHQLSEKHGFPKEKNVKRRKNPRKQSRFSDAIILKIKKIFIWAIILAALYVFFQIFKEDLFGFMKGYPIIWNIYTHIEAQILKHTLLGLLYYSFLSSLFFIFLPIEILFMYYMNFGFNIWSLLGIIMIGNLLGLSFNYWFGRIVGLRFVKFLMKDNFERIHKKVSRYGGFIIFFGNIIIFPMEIASLLFGAMKYSYKKFFWYSFFGKIIKFIILIFGKDFFLEKILPWFFGIF
jgi:membrane protein YqaA with SNARE-associated domain